MNCGFRLHSTRRRMLHLETDAAARFAEAAPRKRKGADMSEFVRSTVIVLMGVTVIAAGVLVVFAA